VKLLNLEDISALLNDIEIELIPPGKCCKLWAWYVSQGVEVEPTYSPSNGQQQRQDRCCLYNLEKSHDSSGEERRLQRSDADVLADCSDEWLTHR